MKIRTFAWALVGIIAFSGVAWSQSLGDIARKEEERRKSVKPAGKVYTNDDLHRYPGTPPPDAPPADEAKPAEAAKPVSGPGQAKDTTPSVDQGEDYWRKLITDAKSALARSTSYLDGLQSRVATLTTEFYASEDPVRRNLVWTQRTRVVDDMERLKQDMADQEKAITKIQDDARTAGIPPGWIR